MLKATAYALVVRLSTKSFSLPSEMSAATTPCSSPPASVTRRAGVATRSKVRKSMQIAVQVCEVLAEPASY